VYVVAAVCVAIAIRLVAYTRTMINLETGHTSTSLPYLPIGIVLLIVGIVLMVVARTTSKSAAPQVSASAFAAAPSPAAAPSDASTAAPPAGSTPSVPQPSSTPGLKPGWYPDPNGRARERYWNGRQWTNHTA